MIEVAYLGVKIKASSQPGLVLNTFTGSADLSRNAADGTMPTHFVGAGAAFPTAAGAENDAVTRAKAWMAANPQHTFFN